MLLRFTALLLTVKFLNSEAFLNNLPELNLGNPLQIIYNTLYPSSLTVSLKIMTREASQKIELPMTGNSFSDLKTMLREELVFVIHGFLSDVNEDWVEALAKAYLKRKNVTVFLVDWGTGARSANYYGAASKTDLVSNEIINFIEYLMEKGEAKPSNIHMIGHSLGAHIAGNVGRNISGIHRITGLDPAKPLFVTRNPLSVANFIDVVHTNTHEYGFGHPEPLGMVDFYMNDAKTQPGCTVFNIITEVLSSFQYTRDNVRDITEMFIRNRCSHNRAIYYFIESIDNPDCVFVASRTFAKANSRTRGDFNPKEDSVLGLDTFKYPSRGKFYIMTNDEPPFCKN